MGTHAASTRQGGRRNRLSFALTLSAVFHLIVFGWFAFKRAVSEMTGESQAMNVEIVRLPPLVRPDNDPPTPRSESSLAESVAEAATAAPVREATPNLTRGSGVDPRWAVDLNGPVFDDGRWPRPTLRRTVCDPVADPKRQSAACRREDAVIRGLDRTFDPRDSDDDFAREARRKTAIRRYKDAPGMEGYPGIRCQILHEC